jgi:hypothetical protein
MSVRALEGREFDEITSLRAGCNDMRHPNVSMAAYARRMTIEPGGVTKTTIGASLPLPGDAVLIVDLEPSDTTFRPVLVDIGPDGRPSAF